ncbi:MAG: zinc-binding dehydrogenase [Propionibacteriaceae bacterium]|nr:zinc-binding dehydrogenase [Propionibacteriaceae bacterium]
MRAAYVDAANPADPLAALIVGERPDPTPPDGWVSVKVKAASLNHHDVWSLRGVGLPADRMPMILGTDAVGTTADGREVVVHPVITSPDWSGDATLDPKRTLLSELHQGTLAEHVVVPEGNLIEKPAGLSWEEAACVPTAYLTAFRMLTRDSGLWKPGTVLVQGGSGGVASATIQLAKALGHRVWATARTEHKRAFAQSLGADEVFEPGARLPERVDLVVETVGEATWSHSLKSLRPGGTIVVCGATSGANPPADLNRVFFLQLRIIGSTMGTAAELAAVLALLGRSGVRPHIDRVVGFDQLADAMDALVAGEVLGKVVLRPGEPTRGAE